MTSALCSLKEVLTSCIVKEVYNAVEVVAIWKASRNLPESDVVVTHSRRTMTRSLLLAASTQDASTYDATMD